MPDALGDNAKQVFKLNIFFSTKYTGIVTNWLLRFLMQIAMLPIMELIEINNTTYNASFCLYQPSVHNSKKPPITSPSKTLNGPIVARKIQQANLMTQLMHIAG